MENLEEKCFHVITPLSMATLTGLEPAFIVLETTAYPPCSRVYLLALCPNGHFDLFRSSFLFPNDIRPFKPLIPIPL